MPFKPNRKFRKDYDSLFQQDPISANIFLLLCELADSNGQVKTSDEEELAELFSVRFEDPKEYAI